LIDITRVVGLIVVLVNFGSAISIVHQIRLTYRRKNTIGLSPVPWAMATTNALAGFVYSILIADVVFLLANLAWLIVNGTMVMLLVRYRNSAKTIQGVSQQ